VQQHLALENALLVILMATLSATGQNVISARVAGGGSAPSTFRGKTIKDMSIDEMERALDLPEPGTERVRALGAPQTARALLEENKKMIQQRQERKTLERKNSQELNNVLLEMDRMTIENDKARRVGRRRAHQELAKDYKTKIAQKELAKSNEYNEKVQSGVQIQYFPFVEGENINKSREEQRVRMGTEMRGFLQKQREENPPRMDDLLKDTTCKQSHMYSSSGAGHPNVGEHLLDPIDNGNGDGVAPHMAKYPGFLSRAREHMSRRLRDDHVKKTLELKVQSTKEELEALNRKCQEQQQQLVDGLAVNDALRYDQFQSKAAERRRNAEYLKEQMKTRKAQDDHEVRQRRSEPHGYWGPEEKELQDDGYYREHCSELINQMTVDQHRRLHSRNRRLRQERQLNDNSMSEMMKDRERLRQKSVQHREVLTTTWKSQRVIKDIKNRIDGE